MDNLLKSLKENEVIGRHKYESLKSYNFNEMTAEQMVEFRKLKGISVAEAEKQIQDYEDKWLKPIKIEAVNDYFNNLNRLVEPVPTELTKEWLWKEFSFAFFENEGKKFIANEDTTYNLKAVFLYYLRDPEFKNFVKNEMDFEKGILVVGDVGNGKSSIMKAFESVFNNSNLRFIGINTAEFVKTYENAQKEQRSYIYDSAINGKRYFDDLKTEPMAWGNTELFKEILEIRERNNILTHATCNYNQNFQNDIDKAIYEFYTKYGQRVYDRVYKMFNIVEFKGKSFRK